MPYIHICTCCGRDVPDGEQWLRPSPNEGRYCFQCRWEGDCRRCHSAMQLEISASTGTVS
jgi:hypothetical protein